MATIRICKNCGKEFEVQGRGQKYCWRKECIRERQRKSYAKQTGKTLDSIGELKTKSSIVKKCEFCGAEFTAKRKSQKYCQDPVCLQKRRTANYFAKYKPEPKWYTITCKACGKEFESKWPNRVLCDDPECIAMRTTKGTLKKIRKPKEKKVAEKKLYKRVCLHCGRSFETYIVNKNYCDDPFCKYEVQKIRKKKYEENQRNAKKQADRAMHEYQKAHRHKKVKPTWDEMSGEDLLHYGRKRTEQYRQTGKY